MKLYAAASFVAFSITASITVCKAQLYQIVDLGFISKTSSFSRGRDINNLGHATGFGDTGDAKDLTHGYLYSNGLTKDINAADGQVLGFAINDSDVIVGQTSIQTGNFGFIWNHGSTKLLPTFGGINSSANGINNKEVVVGTASQTINGGNISRAFVYDGIMHNLGTFSTFSNLVGPSFANAINSVGQVVGQSFGDVGFYHAFVHTGTGPLKDSEDLGNPYAALDNSQAFAINESGSVAGYVAIPGTAFRHASVWMPSTPNGTTFSFLDLHPKTLDGSSEALAINDQGIVVGNLLSKDFLFTTGFVYKNGQLIDLQTLIPSNTHWHILGASGINNRGDIIVDARYDIGGQIHALILTTAVPEPDLTTTSVLGVFGTLIFAFRKSYGRKPAR